MNTGGYKRRRPLTIEDAVTQAIGILGDDGVEAATGKSSRLVRYWGEPDDDTHHIPLHQAFRLDAACLLADGFAPIAAWYRASLLGASRMQTGEPLLRLAAVAAEMGDVARAVHEARSTGSLGGAAITRVEAAGILRQSAELRDALDRLDADVSAAVED